MWLVTGASRGLGTEIARAALAAGHRVVATGRRPAAVAAALGEVEDLLVHPLDVTRPADADAAVAAALARFGRIDVLVNNAGYGQFGYFEELSPEQIERQFATNVFGTMHVTRSVLPSMRTRRAGRILTVSSASGLVGGAGRSAYHASKFAVEGFMESLRLELAPFGILTTVVDPGFVGTEFLSPDSLVYGDRSVADYAEQSATLQAWHEAKRGHEESDPVLLARALVDLAASPSPPRRFVAGPDAYDLVRSDLAQRAQELEAGRAESLALAYAGDPAAGSTGVGHGRRGGGGGTGGTRPAVQPPG